MKLVDVIAVLEQARDTDHYGCVEVTIPNQEDTEEIMNSPKSIDNKIEYYKNTYDEDGVHKHCRDIRIVNAVPTLRFDYNEVGAAFCEALYYMKKGHKMKLPDWSGYWTFENGTIMMHTKDGEVINLFDTDRPEYTLDNIASNEWIIAE